MAFEAIKRHPIAYATGGAILAALSWIAQVWPLFSEKPPSQAIRAWWMAMTAAATFQLVMAVLISTVSITMLGWIIYQQKRETAPAPATSVSGTTTETDWSWLTLKASADLKGGECPVIVWKYEATLSLSKDPYVDFTVTLYNGSVWPIAVSRTVDGYISLDGGDLKGPPQLTRTRERIEPQTADTVVLRQWLVAGEDYSRNARFDLSRLKVWIVKNPDGLHKQGSGPKVSLYLGALTAIHVPPSV